MSFFCCPICGAGLQEKNGCLKCENNHSFDIAAEGYSHLLMCNKMHSRIPGDNKQMVNARRRFLEEGYYKKFSDAINAVALDALEKIKNPVVLDAGCGEGYYTARLYAALCEKKQAVKAAAFDISKFAVKAAAKKYKGIEFAVASSFDIPAADGTADFLLNVFAPIVPAEARRVLKKGGTMLVCVPTPRHLFALKAALYEKPYENERHDTDYPGFKFCRRVTAEDKITLKGNEMIQNLFSMTPYYWKTPQSGTKRLAELSELCTEIGFDLLIYTAV